MRDTPPRACPVHGLDTYWSCIPLPAWAAMGTSGRFLHKPAGVAHDVYLSGIWYVPGHDDMGRVEVTISDNNPPATWRCDRCRQPVTSDDPGAFGALRCACATVGVARADWDY